MSSCSVTPLRNPDAHITQAKALGGKLIQLCLYLFELGDTRYQVVVFEDIEIGQGDCACGRVAGIGRPVPENRCGCAVDVIRALSTEP